MPKAPKRRRDPNQLGKLIVDISVGEVEDTVPYDGKNNRALPAQSAADVGNVIL